MDRDNSFGKATHYGLGIESRRGQDFPHSFTQVLRPNLLYSGYRVFPGVKWPRRGVDHPTPSSAEVKERVELYLYYTCEQGRIKLFGAPRQWKHFRPLFQAVFLSGGGGDYPPDSQTPRLPVPRQK